MSGAMDNSDTNHEAKKHWSNDDRATLTEALDGDGQRPGSASYSDYGQDSKTYEGPDEDQQLYIREGDEYKPVTKEQANDKDYAKDSHRYYLDADSGEYVTAIATADASTFENTAEGNQSDGTVFEAKSIGTLTDGVSAVIDGEGTTVSSLWWALTSASPWQARAPQTMRISTAAATTRRMSR